MGWTLPLDKEREWPAGRRISQIELRDPTLKDLRALPDIDIIRTLPGGSTVYGTNWDAVDAWLKRLATDSTDHGLIDQLSPAEAERAKGLCLGFFISAAAGTPSSAPPTTSVSVPDSGSIRID